MPARRAHLLRGAALGIDLGATKVRAGLVGPAGRVLRASPRVTLDGRTLPSVMRAIDEALETLGPRSDWRALPAGIAVAAQVDHRSGAVHYAPNLGWRSVPLGRRMAQRLGHPVTVENDVRAALYAEWRYGAGRGAANLVMLWVGTGVGGGVVLDGRLLRGHAGAAGELGHLTVVSGGRKCHCPHRGCLEAYVGGWAIEERARERSGATSRTSPRGRWPSAEDPRPSAAAIFREARRGVAPARQLLAETEGYLRAGAITIANAFNPQRLVLGGPILSDWPGLPGRLQRSIRRSAQPPLARVQVVRARLGDWAPVIGAARRAALPGRGARA